MNKYYLAAGCAMLAIVAVNIVPASAAAANSNGTENTVAGDTQATPVSAAQPTTPDASASADIVVTAMKGAGSVQRTPAAVSVLSSDELVRSGINSLDQITKLAPGIQIAPIRTQAIIFLRGVGTQLTTPNADPTVAVNINGAYIPQELTETGFFDLDRIEVLPGPQGTLYGRNSTGGVVNLITRRPGDSFATDGFIEVGNYARVQAQMAVDTPITDDLAIRTAASIIRHDGYDSNGGDDQDTVTARGTLYWHPGSKTKVIAVATYSHDGGIGPLPFNNPPLQGPYRTFTFNPEAYGYSINYRTFTSSLEVDRDLNSQLSLTYVGGYDKVNQFADSAAVTGPPRQDAINTDTNRNITQELRLNGDFGKLKTITGLYYFDTKATYSADIVAYNASNAVTSRTLLGPFAANSHGWAVFGQATYSIFDSLRLIGGLRYSSNYKYINGINTNIVGTTSTSFPFVGNYNFNRIDWKGGVEFDVLPHTMLYGNVSTGFTPGGLSGAPAALSTTQAATFKPALLTAYTAGLKNRFFGNALTLNVEGFYYDYRNYQVAARDPNTHLNITYNAAKARVYGVQVDSALRLSAADSLTASLSLLSAKAIQLVTPVCNCDNFTLPLAPTAEVNASYQHIFDLSRRGTLEANVTGNYITSRWATYYHAAGTYIGATHTIDATLTYRPLNRKVSLALWVRNLTNEIVPEQVGTAAAPAGPGSVFLAPPRTYGARFGFNF